ncbi:MAG: hypothetical protein FJX75_02785 [Armatimonadetes bacterium]|nr:hypothetical protein [Armatimonadota bacterium]
MKRQLALLAVAGLMGALGALAIQTCLQPTPAYAQAALGRLTPQADGSVVISARSTTLVLTPDGTVRVTSPERIVVGGPGEDLKIEGSRVTIDASSEFKVETSDVTIDTSDFVLEGSHIEIGEYNSDIKLADGSDPICINDDGEIKKSEKVKAR